MTDEPNALVQTRNEIVEAQSAGDLAKANAAYARELQTLAEQSSKPPPEKTPATGKLEDHLYKTGLVSDAELRALGDLESDKDVIALSELVGSTIKQLSATGRTIQIDQVVGTEKIAKFMEGFTNDEVRELTASVTNLPRALTVASGFLKIALKHRPDLRVPDSFIFWKVALPVVERIHRKYSQARSSATPADASTRGEFLDTLHKFERRIAELQARGLWTDANRTYQEQMQWIASQQSEQRIVGGGRWA